MHFSVKLKATLPVFSVLKATKYILGRLCGTPKNVLSKMTSYGWYPSSINCSIIVLYVFPESCLFKLGTFSKNTILGFLHLIISINLKNTVPLGSLNPLPFPACENGWQGKPAQIISKSGSSSAFMSNKSFESNWRPKLFKYVISQLSLISFEYTNSASKHDCSIPSRKPPIPVQNSAYFII